MKYQGKTYDRVMLVGGSGSGKSWTAERLGRLTGMPVIYLDKECWQPGWKYPPKEEWEAKNRNFYRLLGFIWTSYRKRREHILSLHEKYPVMMLQFKRTGQVKRFLADVEKENRKSG